MFFVLAIVINHAQFAARSVSDFGRFLSKVCLNLIPEFENNAVNFGALLNQIV